MSDQQNERGPAPFDLTCTPAVPELLLKLNMTVAISTYQAAKVIFISPQNEEKLVQLPRSFLRAMAMGRNGSRLAIASGPTVEILASDDRLAADYPRKQNVYDTIFLPRASYHTGRIDCHGLEWGTDGLWAINTRFSSLCLIDDEFGFKPRWKPPFVSELVSEDRCHLNGMTMMDGAPRYVTTLNNGDTNESWKETIPEGGLVIDVTTNEIIAEGLPMPHSPRFVGDDLYLLLSATGELARVDTKRGTWEVVHAFNGFVRGMTYYRDHLFIATSKIRKNSSSFKKLKIADTAKSAGIFIFHVPTATVVGRITYDQSVDEIFDLVVLPGTVRPNIVSPTMPVHSFAYSYPEGAKWLPMPKNDGPEGQGGPGIPGGPGMRGPATPPMRGEPGGQGVPNQPGGPSMPGRPTAPRG